tara:strand:- start:515 stop:679 length:165 start_codon:yes stop_codon:yes gene_type:complete
MIEKKYIMKRSRTPCPYCGKHLIKKTIHEFYCSKCKKRFTKKEGSNKINPDENQ